MVARGVPVDSIDTLRMLGGGLRVLGGGLGVVLEVGVGRVAVFKFKHKLGRVLELRVAGLWWSVRLSLRQYGI